jgi:hypothetical protein
VTWWYPSEFWLGIFCCREFHQQTGFNFELLQRTFIMLFYGALYGEQCSLANVYSAQRILISGEQSIRSVRSIWECSEFAQNLQFSTKIKNKNDLLALFAEAWLVERRGEEGGESQLADGCVGQGQLAGHPGHHLWRLSWSKQSINYHSCCFFKWRLLWQPNRQHF